MSEKEKVVVTGGSGLLGSMIVRMLIKEENVTPIVMDINPDTTRLDDIKDKIEYVLGDISDAGHLNATFAQFNPRKIIHLAVLPGDLCEKNPVQAVKVNVSGFMNLMNAARVHKVEQFLFSSSATTYGEDLEPGAMLTDKILQRPASMYGITKLFSESVGRWFRKKYDFDYRGIHYPAIIGPGLRAAGIVTFASAMIELPAKGKSYTIPVSNDIRLSLVYVEDAARALIDLGKAPKEKIKTINYFINGVKNPLPNVGEMVKIVKAHIPGAQVNFEINQEWNNLLKSASHPVDDSSSVAEWNWTPRYDSWDKVIDAYLRDLAK